MSIKVGRISCLLFFFCLLSASSSYAEPGGEGGNTNCQGQGNPNSPCEPGTPGNGNGGQGGAGGAGGAGGNASSSSSSNAASSASATGLGVGVGIGISHGGSSTSSSSSQGGSATGGNAQGGSSHATGGSSSSNAAGGTGGKSRSSSSVGNVSVNPQIRNVSIQNQLGFLGGMNWNNDSGFGQGIYCRTPSLIVGGGYNGQGVDGDSYSGYGIGVGLNMPLGDAGCKKLAGEAIKSATIRGELEMLQACEAVKGIAVDAKLYPTLARCLKP